MSDLASSPPNVNPLRTISQDLDALYGESISPHRVGEKETYLSPRSLQKLDEETAPALRAFMQATASPLGVSAYVYCELPILWVVDKDGAILFAVEEMVDTETDEFRRPRLRQTSVGAGLEKLGHPALVEAKAARIGGEILFDVRAETPTWIISNASGRYGLVGNRTETQLDSVVDRFAGFGIQLIPQFLTLSGTV